MRLVSRLVAALVVLGLLAQPGAVAAETRLNPTLRYDFGSVGLGVGQSLRVTIVNLMEPPDAGAPPSPDIDPCWHVRLVDAEGRTVADSGDIELPPGRTRTFTVERATLGRTGEARTGRLQLRAVVVVENDNPLAEVPEAGRLRLGVEVLSTLTGHTTLALSDPPEPERIEAVE